MAKFGLPTPSACYAASIGIRDRSAAIRTGESFDRHGGGTYTDFIRWLNTTETAVLAREVDPATARLLVQRAADLAATPAALRLLATGEGTITADLRGIAYDRWPRLRALPTPSALQLRREPDNPHDTNAIAVLDRQGRMLGYVAREIARSVAPLVDTGSTVTARLIDRTSGPQEGPGHARMEIRCTGHTT
jgi:hypothetical protein